MPIVKKDLDKMIPGHTPEFEAAEAADNSRDVVGPIGSAINSEEETIVFYRDLLDMFPDFEPVLQDIISEEEKHIGQLQVLRDNSSEQMKSNIEKGVEEAEHQLETGSSEEPDDLGEAEVEVDDIAIEISEDGEIEIEPVEVHEEKPTAGETEASGEIPTEGDFKEYSDKADIEAARAEIDSEDDKSRYIDDILNEDISKKKWIYQGPIYDDYGMVVRDGYEWVHADDKQSAIKELIKRLKKAYKSSHIHIEPQFIKAEGEELSEGIYSYQTFVTNKPGEKSPTKSLVYRNELIIEHSPYGIDKLGPTWKNHIDKLISWCYENYPGLPRVTADYRQEKFGREADSKEAYISAIEDELKRGRMTIQESLVTEDFNMAFGSDDFDGEVKAMRDEQKERERQAANRARNPEVKPGDRIRIIKMDGEPHYDGKEGEVDYIDSIGQIHGTWGGLAVVPEVDIYEIIVEESLDLGEDLEDLEEGYIFKKLASLPDAKEQMLDLLSLDVDVGKYFTTTEMLPVSRFIRAPWTILKQQQDGELTDFNFDTDGSILIDYVRDNGFEKTEDLEYIITTAPRDTITYKVLRAIKNTAERLNKQTRSTTARDANVETILKENSDIAEEFKAHITKIIYEIPMVDTYSPLGEVDKSGDEISEEARAKLEQIYYNFMNLPFADSAIDAGIVKHRDFTTDYNHNIISRWGGIGLITFDCKATELSKKAQAVILNAKVKKEDDPSIKDTGNTISCYRLANALIKYYDNDVNFFNQPPVPPADTADTERTLALVASHEVTNDQDTLTEAFDLEDDLNIFFVADDCKCQLTEQDIEEFIEPEGIIEDMKDIYQILCGKYDDVNIDHWCYTEDGIRVYFCNAKSGYLDIDESELI